MRGNGLFDVTHSLARHLHNLVTLALFNLAHNFHISWNIAVIEEIVPKGIVFAERLEPSGLVKCASIDWILNCVEVNEDIG